MLNKTRLCSFLLKSSSSSSSREEKKRIFLCLRLTTLTMKFKENIEAGNTKRIRYIPSRIPVKETRFFFFFDPHPRRRRLFPFFCISSVQSAAADQMMTTKTMSPIYARVPWSDPIRSQCEIVGPHRNSFSAAEADQSATTAFTSWDCNFDYYSLWLYKVKQCQTLGPSVRLIYPAE